MRTSGTVVAALLAGCAVGPDYDAPRPEVPGSWSEGNAPAGDLSEWWTAFRDPILATLVGRALSANLDLRSARARVREARALWGVARGGLLPEAGAGGGYERLRWSENGLFPSDGEPFDRYAGGFDASWEIDLFGGNRRRLEAAQAGLEASVEALRDVRVSLLAELARAYVQLRGDQARLAIARQNEEAQRKTAELVKERLDAGQASEFDRARAEAQASATAAAIPALEASVRRGVHAVALLLGRDPGALAAELSGASPIPAAPEEIPAGLPTDLLRRRPDIRRAERELAAATARVGVATADLYPRFFLFGSFGAESLDASDAFTAASRTWSVGPSVRWSLFEGGRIRANVEVRNARQEEAAVRFEQAVLASLRDVEDALVSRGREQVRRAALARSEESQRRAVVLANERYVQGLADLLAVLDAQRRLYEAQDALVLSEQALATHAIALYKALGGGWTPRS